VLHVQTALAKTRPLVRTLKVSGTIDDNAMRHRVLSAYVDGRIDKLHVNYIGAEVTEGQPLAEFYSPSLLQAEREYRQLGGELRKNTALRLRQMGLTQQQIDTLDQKPADSLTSQILSPISGTVVAQSIYEGQYVATGQQLFEIADFSTMWFMFRAYEQDMPWIKPGQPVTVTTPSIPNKEFVGKVTFIDPNFDEATRSTKVRVELDNPLVNGRRELLHRLYADGMIALEAPAVLTIPRSAVIETGSDAVVYIDKEGGAYEHTIIKTGRRGDTLVEVLSGVKESDAVVTNGNLLIDGQAEMDRAFMSPPETMLVTAPLAGLNEEQRKSIADFIKVADSMAAALAADDLAKFNVTSQRHRHHGEAPPPERGEPRRPRQGASFSWLRRPESRPRRLPQILRRRHLRARTAAQDRPNPGVPDLRVPDGGPEHPRRAQERTLDPDRRTEHGQSILR
jgi:Cu(I)/Ag(I) efflux system membrane fusion protein